MLLRIYMLLPEANELKGHQGIQYKQTMEDFTGEDMERINHMQEILGDYNRLFADPEIDIEAIMPGF